MKTLTLAAAAASLFAASAAIASPVTMDWSTVGNAGNAADPATGFGSVSSIIASAPTRSPTASTPRF